MKIHGLQIEWGGGKYVLLVGGIEALLSIYPAIKNQKWN